MATGDDLVVIRPRIAQALNISDGDEVEFLFNEVGESFPLKVKISDQIRSDILIHDLLTLGIAKSLKMDNSGEHITLQSGRVILSKPQGMWAGMRIYQQKGSARLYFDGASRNNPKGPCGYGFRIVKGESACSNDSDEDMLVEGSMYGGMDRSSNEMEYEGLIEGLIWATRLDLKKLVILGDSQLIIKQLTGEYSIRNHRLRALHKKVCALLECNGNLETSFEHIPREQNAYADLHANQAILTRNSVVSCNWPKINQMMAKSI
eukprot:CAMPEP_0116014582 /NCGR_PEP_ID=MMETSP0321-20121206/6349_1 /TAXON_ID=163516 /ORGANISM="Leptocylindrus danicus var. danicus, Strain B650" /LENGTH=262 /DNA_ID=CAMNT_0003484233 /DNA_START=383 /DNA_END=1171 /DNA_ORIENTATION=-